MRRGRIPAWVLPTLVVTACATDWEVTTDDAWRVLRATTGVSARQRLQVEIDVEPGEAAMLLTMPLPAGRRGFVQRLRAPGGAVVLQAEDWWESGTNLTNAVFSSDVVSLNWPISPAQDALEPGRWRLDLRVDEPGLDVDVSVSLKGGAALEGGVLGVDVVLAAAVAEDPDLLPGVEAALERWAEELYPGFGVQVDLHVRQATLPSVLAAPGFGAERTWQALADGVPFGRVLVVIGEEVEGGSDILGIAGGIPGPLVATRRSGVLAAALSASFVAGADGVMDQVESRLFSETLGHEVGHYLGLFHPFELPRGGGDVNTWDALESTATCNRMDDCVRVLGGNMMFPTPVCSRRGALRGDCEAFLAQDRLTDEQAGVLHRYVGVR